MRQNWHMQSRPDADPIFQRNNVNILSEGTRTMVFAHGFGCDQNMWRFVAPAFTQHYKVVLFDHVGAGGSDLSQFSEERYGSLRGYASDLLEVCRATASGKVVLVGHSVSAMMAILAAREAPELFSELVLVSPSPSYINDAGYVGGFERPDIDQLLDFLDSNYLGWSSAMAPAIMGNPDRPELGQELENSFCRTDPKIAKHFARTTFLSDHREDLAGFDSPTLILQCADDAIAPADVGHYMQRQMPGSTLVLMKATGHCPNLSHPQETIAAMRHFLGLDDSDER